MSKLIMGIGVPASGKTTALKALAEKNNYTYVAPDDIRQEMTGRQIDQTKNAEVWAEAKRRVQESLKEGKSVVFDATFAKDFERIGFIRFARQAGAEKVQGVFADVPFEVANERNKKRERIVPEHAMQRMYSMLESNPPVVEDGFDAVFDMNEFQELTRAETQGENDVLTREIKIK